MLALALLAGLAAPQDLAGIAETLERAIDRPSYEKGAYRAARDLAEMHGPEAMELRLALFDDKLDSYRGVYLRDWFYTGMQRARTLEEAELLVRAASDRKRSELQRVLCLRALAGCEAPVPADGLVHKSFLRAPDAVRREWQRTLGALHSTVRLQAQGRLERTLDETVRTRLEAAGPPYTGLAALGPAQATELLLQAAVEADDAGDRAEAILALEDADAIVAATRAAWAAPEMGPRAAALRRVVDRDVRLAAPVLIDALEAELPGAPGRAADDVAAALMALTGQQLGASAEVWRRWWEEHGARWLAQPQPPRRLDGGDAPERPAADKTVARIFGLPVRSRRVGILVDGSGSMAAGRIGERTCAEAAADELEAFLGTLPDGGRFNLWMVDTEPRALFKSVVPVDRRTREQAVEHLRRFEYRHASALVDAIEAAAEGGEVDTLVLISDGGSSAGIHQYPGHMLEWLERVHDRTGIRIHAVFVGEEEAKRRFLDRLVRLTGGRLAMPRG